MDNFWVDSHCHPHYDGLNINCIKEAYDEGINKICCVATGLSDHEILMKCKKKYKVAISIGEHPNNDFKNVNWDFMESILNNYEAIGETGFDFQTKINPQIEAFEIQAAFAQKYNLPIILHIRDSGDGHIEKLTMEELKKFPRLRAVFHCFVGSQQLADFACDRGFFLSFSGIITFKKSEELRNVMKNSCVDNFLIETDSPFLAPVPKRGKINHPKYVRYIGEFISNFLSLNTSEFSCIVSKNFDKLYYGSHKD